MKNNELLKGIEQDNILKQITETLIIATKNAQEIPEKLMLREAQLRDKLKYYHQDYRLQLQEIDDIEKIVEQTESRGDIERKLAVIISLKGTPWENDKKYREAIGQYYTYITPILTDLETAKQKTRNKIAEIKARYERELSEAYKEFNSYENRVEEFFKVTGEIGPYAYQLSWNRQFGRIARSDDFALTKANFYNESKIEHHERKPKITKHISLDGIQRWLSARPR